MATAASTTRWRSTSSPRWATSRARTRLCRWRRSKLLLFRPLTAGDLPLVRAWLDEEAARWLGGPEWSDETLALANPAHGRHAATAVLGGAPVGLVDVEAHASGQAGFAIVVAPAARRRGVGRAILGTLPLHAPLAGITEFFAGVEEGNTASERLLLSAGFAQVTFRDAEGFRYFARRLDGGQLSAPWQFPGH